MLSLVSTKLEKKQSRQSTVLIFFQRRVYNKTTDRTRSLSFYCCVTMNYFTRSPYERSVVFTRIFSPMLMKSGAMMMAPVSRVTSF